ncbi:MAG: hypothetical protein JOZ27_08670, partial [Caulobacteraceae bacterium]|nr:hypothetical protein [Caulobacteraceae bacterium]
PQAAAWPKFFEKQRIWAYVDRASLAPGEPLNLMAACDPGEPPRRVRIELFRIGAAGPAPVWQSDFFSVAYRGATASGATTGPGWPPSLPTLDTRSWTPGCYSLDIVEQTTATRDVKAATFVVTNPRRSGAVLLRLAANTYQAYNSWGGHSLYPNGDDEARGLMVGFDRPTPPSFFEYDVYLVQWLEGLAASLGGVDYCVNFDVHRAPDLLDAYPLAIAGAHDEYWSMEEYDAFHRRIFQRGQSTCFFGADTAYCQVRYADLNRAPGEPELGRQIVCYKTAFDPIQLRAGRADPRRLVTANFRDGARRPETMLLGGAYQGWFEPASPQTPMFKVVDASLPYFAGTGWKAGDDAAPVIGYEWDNRDPDGDGARLWAPGRSLDAAIPAADIRVLFRGTAVDVDGRAGVAEATYYVSPAGARVFNAGAVRWAWGLGKAGFTNAPFRRFNENLVRALSRRV